MALDSGIHAGMTAFLARRDLCITMRAPAWVRGMGFRWPRAQAGAWGSQAAVKIKQGLEVPPMS